MYPVTAPIKPRANAVMIHPGAEDRHDPCVLPREVPIVEAIVALDRALRQAALR